ncbi:MAG: nucleotide-binding universal stress UspA family protein [Lentimonas sp.]|jgi:nucleotide-binding universal stress UspA family protein
MKRYKKIIIPLGLGNTDTNTIAWASKISHLARSEEALFVHAVEVQDIPAQTKEKYPWLLQPLDETLMERMKEQVAEAWQGHADTAVSFKLIHNTSDVLAILSMIVEQDSDLVIIGRESFRRDMAIRLTRKAPCSVMVIPTDANVSLNKILAPTDFSTHCRNALDVAVAFAEAANIPHIDSLHVYNLGPQSHKATLPKNELKRMANSYYRERHSSYLENLDSKSIDVISHEAYHSLTAAGICNTAEELDVDLIVAGCRGRGTVAALLIGSNAEQLLQQSTVPIIAAKIKGSGQKLLDALLQG